VRKLVPQYFDDLDGLPVTEDELKTRSLTVDGVPFVLDLRASNSTLLDDALRPFLSVANRADEGQLADEAPPFIAGGQLLSADVPVLCPACFGFYSNRASLRDHTRKVHDQALAEIEHDRGFTQAATPDQIAIAEAKQFACPRCGYVAVAQGDLDSHAVKHFPVSGRQAAPQPEPPEPPEPEEAAPKEPPADVAPEATADELVQEAVAATEAAVLADQEPPVTDKEIDETFKYHCDAPGCDFKHYSPSSLGVHKKFKHGVEGSSEGTAYRRGEDPRNTGRLASDPLVCPECAAEGVHFRANAAQGLGAHRRAKHGRTGQSWTALKYQATHEVAAPEPAPEPQVQPLAPSVVAGPEPIVGAYEFMCEVPGCDFPGTDRAQTYRGHQRMKHGIGGKSSAEMFADRKRQAAEVKAAKERHAAERLAREQAEAAALLADQQASAAEQLVNEQAEADAEVAKPHGKKRVDLGSLTDDVLGGPRLTIVPGVNVPAGPGKRTKLDPRILSDKLAEPEPGEFDWTALGDRLEEASQVARQHLRKGIPPAMRYTYYPDLFSIEGMDLDIVDSCLREPERVEVAPETFEKHYTILRFYKGDCLVALGMRTPNQPQVIAAYHGSLLANDTHRVNHTGGGGKREQAGLPKNARETANRLQAKGASIELVEGSTTATVTYKDNDLGKISVGPATAKEVAQSDYQRSIRRIEAIDRRAAADRRVAPRGLTQS
jgi:hypothetical protein